ncbi:cell division transport system permease protein [Seinonella peptonophila]|uniref:Cell division protein FtsX n=1 Tax=Seinonella peptonophila TaxID=112248 RepID=A0A1M4XQB4_9BACL|nr:permease-like cell division protein FtsX [Seinonella peptonophila]SHE95422.1 cell division transport system permease protein [Seinonella peptonophila]
MKIETLTRHLREAYRGVQRNLAMSFAAISAVAVTLFVFGIFLIVAFNMRYISNELDKQVAITISLKENLGQAKISEMVNKLKADPDQKSVEYVSKEEGLKQIKEQWSDTQFIEGLSDDGSNPLPDVIRIQPKNPDMTGKMAARFEGMPGVEAVDYGQGVTERLLSFSGWLRNIVLIFGFGLAGLSAFLISNTIKLTIIARHREIEIQRLVGASNWFIRWPFFFEGSFIGVSGAVFPIILVLILYQAALSVINDGPTYGIFKLMPMLSLGPYVGGSILLLGAFIGVTGSIISVHRFLKI